MRRPSNLCKLSEFCNLPSVGSHDYCELHLPRRNKDVTTFNATLEAYLGSGRSDFRQMHFPDGYDLKPNGRTFPAQANFQHVVFHSGGLNLAGAILPDGLLVRTRDLVTINLQDASIGGEIDIDVEGFLTTFNCIKGKMAKGLRLKTTKCEAINLTEADIAGRVTIEIEERLAAIHLNGTNLRAGLRLSARSMGNFGLTSGSVEDVTVKAVNGIESINGSNATFRQSLSIETPELADLQLRRAKLVGLLALHSINTRVTFTDSEITEGLDLAHSQLKTDRSSFEKVSFGASAYLNLDAAVLYGDLAVVGSPTPPKLINLNGTTVKGDTTIRSQLGEPLIEVVATKNAPEFGGKVTFANVDLSNCRLVGNPIDSMQLSNVKWREQDGRAVLYDEKLLKVDRRVTKNIKEAYQVLKEKYRQLGDHVTSGDFHYGEMQMKRREYGRIRRFLGLEAWYYYLSGYGTNPKLAALWLVFIILLFTWLFNLFGDDRLRENVVEALILSIQAATLQPVPWESFNLLSRLLFSLERILAPLQIGLLALAVRMRLKR